MDKEITICSVRNAADSDLLFYASMLLDRQWLDRTGYRYLDFNSPKKILNFISPKCNQDIKWVVKLTKTDRDIGFCHFKMKHGYAETDGGIIKPLMNSSLSIICYIYCINKYFSLDFTRQIHSIIYAENKRSLKMHLALGFKPVSQMYYDSRLFYKAVLYRDIFYNSYLTKRFLKR